MKSGFNTEGSLAVVPKIPGSVKSENMSINKNEYYQSLGACVFGIVRPTSCFDSDVLLVNWPIYQNDKLVWKEMRCERDEVSFVPMNQIGEILNNISEHIASINDPVALPNTELVFPRGMLSGGFVGNESVLLFGDIAGMGTRSVKKVRRCKGKRNIASFFFNRGIVTPDPLRISYPQIIAEEASHAFYPRAYFCYGFRANNEDCADPEKVEVISCSQAVRLAEEYRDQMVFFVNQVQGAYKSLGLR